MSTHSTIPTRGEFLKPKCVVRCTACTDEWACLGQRLTKWSDDFYSAIIAIGTLGAGFTFSVIFSQLPATNPPGQTDRADRVRSLLIVAWILFVLAIAVAAVSSSALRFFPKLTIERLNAFDKRATVLAAVISLILQGLLLAAFIVSARAMKHYDEHYGQAAFVILCVGAGLLGAAWFFWSMSVFITLLSKLYNRANKQLDTRSAEKHLQLLKRVSQILTANVLFAVNRGQRGAFNAANQLELGNAQPPHT